MNDAREVGVGARAGGTVTGSRRRKLRRGAGNSGDIEASLGEVHAETRVWLKEGAIYSASRTFKLIRVEEALPVAYPVPCSVFAARSYR